MLFYLGDLIFKRQYRMIQTIHLQKNYNIILSMNMNDNIITGIAIAIERKVREKV